MKKIVKNLLYRFGYKVEKIQTASLPVNYNLSNLVPRSKSDLNDDVNYAISISNGYLADIKSRAIKIKNADILEIGPGINFGTALILLWNGAHSVTVSDKYLAGYLEDYHGVFYEKLKTEYFSLNPDLEFQFRNHIMSYKEFISSGRLSLVESSLETLNKSQFDCTFSCAVLEHVRNPISAVKSLYQLTKPGGFGSHQIDFRDHRNFDKPLDYLLLDEMSFIELFDSVHGECGNRMRAHEWNNIFTTIFSSSHVKFVPNMWADQNYLSNFHRELSESLLSPFRLSAKEELSILSGKFIYERL